MLNLSCVPLKFMSEMRLDHLTTNFWSAGRHVFQRLRTDMLHTISSLFPRFIQFYFCQDALFLLLIWNSTLFIFLIPTSCVGLLFFSPLLQVLAFFRVFYLSLGESYRGGGRGKWDINKIIKLLTLTIKYHFFTNITNKIQ